MEALRDNWLVEAVGIAGEGEPALTAAGSTSLPLCRRPRLASAEGEGIWTGPEERVFETENSKFWQAESGSAVWSIIQVKPARFSNQARWERGARSASPLFVASDKTSESRSSRIEHVANARVVGIPELDGFERTVIGGAQASKGEHGVQASGSPIDEGTARLKGFLLASEWHVRGQSRDSKYGKGSEERRFPPFRSRVEWDQRERLAVREQNHGRPHPSRHLHGGHGDATIVMWPFAEGEPPHAGVDERAERRPLPTGGGSGSRSALRERSANRERLVDLTTLESARDDPQR
ncbi:hypothetical protein C8J57DRAFT_1233669 [Mycena rebaudengoi]|nr:hypothetical protein C8J57DRAFT_1233669 [Mycena rebaudengoi]